MRMTQVKKLRSSRGQALIIAVMFFVAVSALIVFSITSPLMRASASANAFANSKESFYVAEAGLEDGFFRLKTGKELSATESIPIGSHVAEIVVNNLSGNRREIIADGDIDGRVRRGRVSVRVGEGATFNFGVQSDTGGILMENSSSIDGNAFSNGTIQGSGSNFINGDAISAGPLGEIDGVHTAVDSRAHTIRDSTVDGDAYYFDESTLISTFVGGSTHPGSEDQATTTMPLSDEEIDVLKADAEAGGITVCSGTLIINSNQTIGPQKYTCNLEIRNNPVITLGGAIWVEGDINLRNSPSFVIDPAIASEGQSIPIVADNESNRTTSSKIIFQNSGYFDGGEDGGYVVFISQNEDAENGGTNVAISIENGATGDVLVYAAHGEVLLRNNVDLKEVTAYLVHLQNSAEVKYETGLLNVNFTSGPGASFNLESWEEIE